MKDQKPGYPSYLLPHCPVSDKVKYETNEECEKACRNREEKLHLSPNRLRPYWCQLCESFHITSKPVGYVESRQDRRNSTTAWPIWQKAVTDEDRDKLLALKRQLEEEG